MSPTTPLARRIAARRSSAPLAPDVLGRRDPQSEPTSSAPSRPAWLERLQARDQTGQVLS